jgi:hypothetical protein
LSFKLIINFLLLSLDAAVVGRLVVVVVVVVVVVFIVVVVRRVVVVDDGGRDVIGARVVVAVLASLLPVSVDIRHFIIAYN